MKLFSKIYIYVFAALSILATLLAVLGHTIKGADLGWAISLLIMAVPLYAYSFDKVYGRGPTWLSLMVVATAFYLLFAFYLDPRYGGLPPQTIGDYLLTLLIPLPGFVIAFIHQKQAK